MRPDKYQNSPQHFFQHQNAGLKLSPALTVGSLVTAALLSACGGGDGGSTEIPPVAQSLSCDDSIKTQFKPDELTKVILVKPYVKGEALPNPGASGARAVTADLCLVKLVVGPGNPGPVGARSTSQGIGLEIWLPLKDKWNGRLHAIGSGGWGGTEEANPSLVSSLSNAWQVAGNEGSVTVTSDTGHASDPGLGATADGAFAMSPDGSINRTLWNDFAHRAIHEQVVKAKALATAYYGAAPKRTYWEGGSSGGRQGLKQAQMYPEDFDGIVVGAPAINWSKFLNANIYPQVAMRQDTGSHISADKLSLVSKAALDACDVVGGQHLGFLLDPAACQYDATKDKQVICASDGGSNTSSSCLTTSEAQVLNKIWYGMTSDGSAPAPSADNGWSVAVADKHRWYGPARGTNLLSISGADGFPLGNGEIALHLQNPRYASPNFLNASGNGADLWKTLTYAQLDYAFTQSTVLQPDFSFINTDEPDLGRFKARGGKLLMYHGLADELVPPQGTINYYERVAAAMGGMSEVQKFFKTYLVPGLGHFGINGTANTAANPPLPASGQMYQVLTDWVEKGVEPQSIQITTPSGSSVQASLPLCAYPSKITYVAGSVLSASSYVCK